jgi:hypothetical protein
MRSLKERLKDKCACRHQGSEHNAHDAGTHISLGRCTACECPQFRRLPSPTERAGKTSLRAHGRYSKRHYRI